MIYVTGDMHGEMDRFNDKKIKKLKKTDTLLICGDFGFIWNDSKEEKKILNKIGKRKHQTLFVEGCHENYDLLKNYPIVDFGGAKARQISGNLFALMRGNIYTIENKTVFAFGGGESEDKELRDENVTWWSEELPTLQEVKDAKEHLEYVFNKVDYIITHDAPACVKNFIYMENHSINHLQAFFEHIHKNCEYKKWFFGKYHLDKHITNSITAVYKNVIKIED